MPDIAGGAIIVCPVSFQGRTAISPPPPPEQQRCEHGDTSHIIPNVPGCPIRVPGCCWRAGRWTLDSACTYAPPSHNPRVHDLAKRNLSKAIYNKAFMIAQQLARTQGSAEQRADRCTSTLPALSVDSLLRPSHARDRRKTITHE